MYPPPTAGAQWPAERPPRPTTVTVAITLLLLGFLAFMVAAIVQVFSLQGLEESLRVAAEATGADAQEIDDIRSETQGGAYISACEPLLVALVLLPLAIFTLRGYNGARIATCIVASLGVVVGLCCLGVLFSVPPDPEIASRFEVMVHERQSNPVLMIGLSGLAGLTWTAAVVLLFMPPSNAFFRRPR